MPHSVFRWDLTLSLSDSVCLDNDQRSALAHVRLGWRGTAHHGLEPISAGESGLAKVLEGIAGELTDFLMGAWAL
jgi:hypothetical protein